MSWFSYYTRIQYLTVSWTISVVLASCLATSTAALEAGPDHKTELHERYVWIQKAMQEQEERVKEELTELHRRGTYPFIRVNKIVPFGDWDFYYVEGGSITWEPNAGQNFKSVVVPKGFVTDLASIPRVFWQIFRPEGRYAYAAVVHDYLYWSQTRPREEADRIFKIAMQDSKVDGMTIEAFYQFVHHFGQAAWDNNARLKQAGERRILKRLPPDLTLSWTAWRKQPDIFAQE